MNLLAYRSPRSMPRPMALTAWAFALLALWLVACWAGPALMAASGLNLNPHAHFQTHAHGHPFADARTLWGVPNAMDVLSNAPLSLAGLWGLFVLRGQRLPAATQRAGQVFFAGLLLTGFGSAWYHWAPDAAGPVADRLGMAVAFAGALALAVADRVDLQQATDTLWTILVLAAVSAVLPFTHHNLMPWAVVQLGGMAFMAWAALQPQAQGGIGVPIGQLVGCYALAKLLELGDAAVFLATAETVSGHSLKHVAAALAAMPVLICVCRQPCAAAGRQAAVSQPIR